jgi:flagellar biosynthesis regulator FlbT
MNITLRAGERFFINGALEKAIVDALCSSHRDLD